VNIFFGIDTLMEGSMNQEQRIYSFFKIDNKNICEILRVFDKSIVIDDVIPIHSGMSTSNYCITVGQTNYLLKIYSGNCRNIEPIMYEYLRKHIKIPTLYYYDDSRDICPYPYSIIEYIHGETLSEYIKRNHCYPTKIAFEIGRMLSIIHEKTYPMSGHIDNQLQLESPWKNTSEFIMSMLEGKPGSRLSNVVQDKLKEYLKKNMDIISRIDRDFVLCHGDIGYGNILIANGYVYFIDFEYAMAESRYRDIGKFFRNKSQDIQRYLDMDIYEAFANGYGGLPCDWMQLAKVADIPVMLGLLNIDTAPQDWVDDIEHDILIAIS
jgi:tRNA A-37 threonylcarbamoyl transferase component Bud32